jgi:hypothetical protein
MTTYLIPTDEDTVEVVARAIARNRIHIDASDAMEQMIGVPLAAAPQLESSLDRIFEELWAGKTDTDERQRSTYRSDALAAIRALNLKLITTPE